ncbi:MAG: alpha/beta hydrolase [Ruminococcaceae bacterium]|nr:alpha/beta hydrolase [Oscillospiraceae bacterium]
MKKDLVLYIHGKAGSADESGHYKALFPDSEVIGLDYKTFTPWETGEEIRCAVGKFQKEYGAITVIANSIGAFFCMNSDICDYISKAFFISPITDMECLILGMMKAANVTEKELETRGIIHTEFGEDLSWKYLCYVREHPVKWMVPTEILYGDKDNLTSYETLRSFAGKIGADITVMHNGEHWFHTEEQMEFLDSWIRSKCDENSCN